MGSIEAALIGHLVREALEGALAPGVASALLFDALAEMGTSELPSEPVELRHFVLERLGPRLRAQLGDQHGQDLLDQLHRLVESSLDGSRPQRPSQAPTANTSVEDGPVRVLVIASAAQIAVRLRVALGEDAVTPYAAPTVEAATRMTSGLLPAIVLIDATHDLPFALDEIVSLLREKKEPLAVVWGIETDLGEHVCEVLEGARGRTVGLPSLDGSSMLMDYVLARRAQP